MRYWTMDEIAVVRRYKLGRKNGWRRRCADELGRTLSSISSISTTMLAQKERPPFWSATDDFAMLKMLSSGEKVIVVASILGRSDFAVYKRFQKLKKEPWRFS
jgi:hypothetical protein